MQPTFSDTIIALARSDMDFSVRQIAVLLVCQSESEPKERQIKSISERLNVAKPIIVRAADKLAEHKPSLVGRSQIVGDRRTCVLTLTKAGRAMADDLNPSGAPAMAPKSGKNRVAA